MRPNNKNQSIRTFQPKFQNILSLTLALAAMVSGSEALACAACGCTISKDWGTQGITATPGFSADLSYNYINQNQQRIGTGTASAAQISALNLALPAAQEIEDYTTTRTTTASLNYTSDTWGVNTQIPFIQRTHGTFGNGGTWPAATNYSSSNDSSIGDISVIGRYTGYSSDKTAGIIAGVKLPTGSTGANFNAGAAVNTPLDRSLQIGTGSTDLILGGFVTGSISDYGWFAQGTVQSAVVTKSTGTPAQDYRPGDAYSLNSGIRYGKFGSQFTPMLQFNLIHRRPDTGAGATPPDALSGGPATGGTLVYLSPGASVRIGGGTSVYGFVQLPIYQNVNSLQLGARYTLTLGVSHSFQ